MSMDKKFIIEHLSLFEKASLLVGYANMKTRPLKNYEIPSLVMSDGPNGVRKETEADNSVNGSIHSLPTTCFPSGSAIANSFDDRLFYQVGKQIALECRFYGINAILGPAINIKRNPLCGRNFEYLSEDPLLAGYLSSSYIKGVQEQKVLACVKHYACNNLEKWRYVGDSVVDLRALNEIYLKPYEIAIRESNPRMLMSSYNRINGTFASENIYLLKDRLRNKFKYDGLTVTDWGGMVNRDLSLNAGQDLEMPGMIKENIQKIVRGVNSNLIRIEDVDDAVIRLLKAIEDSEAPKLEDESIFEQSHEVAIQGAIEGAVLLKNENNILPLAKDKKYLVIGDLFENMRFQGSGSALIHARNVVSNMMAFDSNGIQYTYARGYNQINPLVNPVLENDAISKAKDADEIIFFGGLTDLSESEGYDRPDMKLDQNQIHLLTRLAELNKKIIFVMFGGAPFEIPAYDNLDAVLLMNLPGEGGGEALVKLLFGEVSPTGRLSQTWPIKYEDVPYYNEYCSSPIELYKESIYVGYRYYSTVKQEVRFPFGYGLTYGSYHYEGLKVKQDDEKITVSFNVYNDSGINIAVVPQIYMGKVDSALPRPIKELKGYQRVDLLPNEKKEVIVEIKLIDLYIYNPKTNKDALEDGEYLIYLSDNVNNDIEKESINIKGEVLGREESIYFNLESLKLITKEQFSEFIGRTIEDYQPKKRPYTLETPICEYKSFFGNIVRNYLVGMGNKIIRKAKKIKDEKEKQRQIKAGMFIKKMMPVNCLRSLCYSASGMLPYRKALGLLDLINGRIFRGIGRLL